MKRLAVFIAVLFSFSTAFVWASGAPQTPYVFEGNVLDPSSIRSGAKAFLQNCSSCHGVSYLRYSTMEKDLNWSLSGIEAAGGVLKDMFMLSTSKNPSVDLSLKGRSKGANFLYTYMLSNIFSAEDSVHPRLGKTLKHAEKQKIAQDITTFLVYAAEPIQAKRKEYGAYVLMFLLFFLVIVVLLKREYWKTLK